jgi:hypothetical protein
MFLNQLGIFWTCFQDCIFLKTFQVEIQEKITFLYIVVYHFSGVTTIYYKY